MSPTATNAISQFVTELSARGFETYFVSASGSAYLRGTIAGETYRIRVSDHYVPETEERAYNRTLGTGSWNFDCVITNAAHAAHYLKKITDEIEFLLAE